MLKIGGITKSYPGVKALDNVSLEIRKGEVHVLFGENGAGKSTLINVIAGVIQPDDGIIDYLNERVSFRSRRAARDLGISAVFQELSLVPDLTVEENLALGAEPTIGPFLRKASIHSRALAAISRTGFSLNPSALVRNLSRSERQMVEIAKALMSDLKLLILDEPTAAFTRNEARKLFSLIADLKSEGISIIYITHHIDEIPLVGDRITVLRDGRIVSAGLPSDTKPNKLVELMTGQSLDQFFPSIAHAPTDILLEARNLSAQDGSFKLASIQIRRGEIVGMAGLAGSGKSQIGRVCFGLDAPECGDIFCAGERISNPTPRRMLDRGVCYTPPDRIREGIMKDRSARENFSLASLAQKELSKLGFLKCKAEVSMVMEHASILGLRPLKIDLQAKYFSGGNMQKMILGNALARKPDCLILDEPTIGIDIGAKREIYDVLKRLAEGGCGILLISSDLGEIVHLSNRVYVVNSGTISTHLRKEEISEKSVLTHFF